MAMCESQHNCYSKLKTMCRKPSDIPYWINMFKHDLHIILNGNTEGAYLYLRKCTECRIEIMQGMRLAQLIVEGK